MSQHWSAIAERGNQLGISILITCYKVAGKWLATILLFPVILYFFMTGRQAREASRTFLSRAYHYYPDAFNGKRPGSWAVYRHFLSFGFAALDKVDSWLGHLKHSAIEYENYALFDSLQQQRQGALFIGSHLGNLEVCRALSSHRYNVRINVLVFTQHAQSFNDMLQKLNPDVSLNLIQVTRLGPDTAIMLKERIENGEFVVIVGDRTPVNNPGRVSRCNFMGEEADFSQGPLILASLLECPVYLLFCLKSDAKYRVIFETFAEPKLEIKRKERSARLAQLSQEYADRLAYYAMRYPFQWFNFYDFWQHELTLKEQEEHAV